MSDLCSVNSVARRLLKHWDKLTNGLDLHVCHAYVLLWV